MLPTTFAAFVQACYAVRGCVANCRQTTNAQWQAAFDQVAAACRLHAAMQRREIVCCDPNVDPRDTVRLGAQCLAILNALADGPKTNVELSQLALKYTGRVSDLRAAGYTIVCTRMDAGLRTYSLLDQE